MTDVIEAEFTLPPSFGVEPGPNWATRITRTGGGQEQRNQKWKNPLDSLGIVYNNRVPADYAAMLNLFNAVEGQTYGWLIENPLDFDTAPTPGTAVNFTDVVIGVGDASTTDFQLIKVYTFGTQSKSRKITRPRNTSPDLVRCGVNGVEVFQPGGFTVNVTTGIVTFSPAPPAGQQVTAGFKFLIPVRFQVDRLPAVVSDRSGAGLVSSVSVPIMEIRG